MPRIAAGDTAGTVLRSSVGDVRVGDLLASWRQLAPALRPRIETASQVLDLAHNVLFERALRLDAEARGLEASPPIAAALREARAQLVLSRYLDREILDTLAPDSVSLRRRYDADPAAWAVARRVRMLRLEFAGRAEASAMAARLARPGEPESLEARARRSGISYQTVISADDEPEVVAAAERAGAGGLLGPTKGARGWWVAHVEAFVPARPRSFEAARREVEQRWRAEESERRMLELRRRLRKRADVRLNHAALERLRRVAR
jgi:hypothetical protein